MAVCIVYLKQSLTWEYLSVLLAMFGVRQFTKGAVVHACPPPDEDFE